MQKNQLLWDRVVQSTALEIAKNLTQIIGYILLCLYLIYFLHLIITNFSTIIDRERLWLQDLNIKNVFNTDFRNS